MKKLFFLLAICAMSSPLFAQLQQVKMVATGLTCSLCSNAINKQLKTIEGVQGVDIDLNKNQFIVQLTAANQLSPEVFRQKVEKAGFFVGEMTVKLLPQSNPVGWALHPMNGEVATADVEWKVLNKGFQTEKAFKQFQKANGKLEEKNAQGIPLFHVMPQQ